MAVALVLVQNSARKAIRNHHGPLNLLFVTGHRSPNSPNILGSQLKPLYPISYTVSKRHCPCIVVDIVHSGRCICCVCGSLKWKRSQIIQGHCIGRHWDTAGSQITPTHFRCSHKRHQHICTKYACYYKMWIDSLLYYFMDVALNKSISLGHTCQTQIW